MISSLEITNLSYRQNNKTLLKQISLTFSTGNLYAILGPNGSGKSTLLKNLSGILTPTEGKVLWQEQDLLAQSRASISQTISLVPQNPAVPFDFTVWEIVAMGRYPYYSPRWNNRCYLNPTPIEWALSIVDLNHLKQRPLMSLSIGERQRAYIARSLATQSPILLLDEPTSNLDIVHQLEIWDFLKMWSRQGKIVITAVHDLAAAERFCDHFFILNEGKCAAQGKMEDSIPSHFLSSIFGVKKDHHLYHPQFEKINQ